MPSGAFRYGVAERRGFECQSWLSNEGRPVGRATSERQSVSSVVPGRAFPKVVAKFWRVWSGLGRAKPLGGAQIAAAFLTRVPVVGNGCCRRW